MSISEMDAQSEMDAGTVISAATRSDVNSVNYSLADSGIGGHGGYKYVNKVGDQKNKPVPVTYGSAIKLQTEINTKSDDGQTSKDSSGKSEAYLHTNISHNPKAYVREVSNADAEKKAPNIHTIMFRIVVPYEFKFKEKEVALTKELDRLELHQLELEDTIRDIEEKKDNDGNFKLQNQEKKREEIEKKLNEVETKRDRVVKQRKELAADVLKDEETNKQMQNRQFGKDVKYGDTIQLQHIYTNKYLSVSDTDTAELAVQLVVNLQEHSNKSTEFKISPRFKVRSRGEVVLAGEHISLESKNAVGQYLSCTSEKFGERVVGKNRFRQQGDYEASATAQIRPWMISIATLAEPKRFTQAQKMLQHGDVVRLKHRETSRYLIDTGKGTDASAASDLAYDSLWQVCCANSTGRLDGGAIQWNKAEISLRNLITGKYLEGGVAAAMSKANELLFHAKTELTDMANQRRPRTNSTSSLDSDGQPTKGVIAPNAKEFRLLQSQLRRISSAEATRATSGSTGATLDSKWKVLRSTLKLPGFWTTLAEKEEQAEKRLAQKKSGSKWKIVSDLVHERNGFWAAWNRGRSNGRERTSKDIHGLFKNMNKISENLKYRVHTVATANHYSKFILQHIESDAGVSYVQDGQDCKLLHKETARKVSFDDALHNAKEKTEGRLIDELDSMMNKPDGYGRHNVMLADSDTNSFADVFHIARADPAEVADFYLVEGMKEIFHYQNEIFKKDLAAQAEQATENGDRAEGDEAHKTYEKYETKKLMAISTRQENNEFNEAFSLTNKCLAKLADFLTPVDNKGDKKVKLGYKRRVLVMQLEIPKQAMEVLHKPLKAKKEQQIEALSKICSNIITDSEGSAKSSLEQLWTQALKFLFESCDYLKTEQIGIRSMLSRYFRTICTHMISFSGAHSSAASTLLIKLMSGDQRVLEHLLAERGDGQISDFKWFLSWLGDSEEKRGPRFYNVMAEFCLCEGLACSQAQRLIGQALENPLKTKRKKGQLLEDFDDQHRPNKPGRRGSAAYASEPPKSPTSRAVQRRFSDRLDDEQNEAQILSGDSQFKVKRFPGKNGTKIEVFIDPKKGDVQFERPDETNYITKRQEEDRKKIDQMKSVLVNFKLENRDDLAHDTTVKEVKVWNKTWTAGTAGEGSSSSAVWLPLNEMCDDMPGDRNNTKTENSISTVKYLETSLGSELKYELIVAQLTAMANLCHGRSDETTLVELHYKTDVLFHIIENDRLCHGLRTAAMELTFQLCFDIGPIPDGVKTKHPILPWRNCRESLLDLHTAKYLSNDDMLKLKGGNVYNEDVKRRNQEEADLKLGLSSIEERLQKLGQVDEGDEEKADLTSTKTFMTAALTRVVHEHSVRTIATSTAQKLHDNIKDLYAQIARWGKQREDDPVKLKKCRGELKKALKKYEDWTKKVKEESLWLKEQVAVHTAYMKHAERFHKWLVRDPEEATHGQASSFRTELQGFTDEMKRLIEHNEPWNGVSTANREPFHERHGEFVLRTLKTVKFLVESGYYSHRHLHRGNSSNEDDTERDAIDLRVTQLRELLHSCVMEKVQELIAETTSREDMNRSELIKQLLVITLDILSVSYTVHENQILMKEFMVNYGYIYGLTFETDPYQPHCQSGKPKDGPNLKLQAIGPKSMIRCDDMWFAPGAIHENRGKKPAPGTHTCKNLTDPDLNKHPVKFSNEFKDKTTAINQLSQHTKVTAYLDHLFSATPYCESKRDEFDVALLELADIASEEVATQSISFLVEQHMHKHMIFEKLKQCFVVVIDSTVKKSHEINRAGARMFTLSRTRMLQDASALEFTEQVNTLSALMFKETGNPYSGYDIACQTICFSEGYVHVALRVLLKSHQIDARRVDEVQAMLLACFRLLRNVAHNFREGQDLLFQNFTALLQHNSTSTPACANAFGLTCCHTFSQANYQSQIREHHVQSVCNKILEFMAQDTDATSANLEGSTFYCAAYLDLLKHMAMKTENSNMSSLKFIQQTIITQLLKHTQLGNLVNDASNSDDGTEKTLLGYLQPSENKNEDDIGDAFMDDDDERWMTRMKDPQNVPYVVSYLQLLSECGNGENQYIESICKKVLKVKTLIKVLQTIIDSTLELTTEAKTQRAQRGELIDKSKTIVHESKRPQFFAYLKYLHLIYVGENVALPSAHEAPLVCEKSMWQILTQCAKEVYKFSNCLALFNDNLVEDGKTADDIGAEAYNRQKLIDEDFVTLVCDVIVPLVHQFFVREYNQENFEKRSSKDLNRVDNSSSKDKLVGDDEHDDEHDDEREAQDDKKPEYYNDWPRNVQRNKEEEPTTCEDACYDLCYRMFGATQFYETESASKVDQPGGLARIVLLADSQKPPWWTDERKEGFYKLFDALFPLIVTDEAETQEFSELISRARTVTEKEGIDPVNTRDSKAFAKREPAAVALSSLLEDNKQFDRDRVLVTNREENPGKYMLAAGDDGLVTWEDQVNGEFRKYLLRMLELWAFQNRTNHQCHEPKTGEGGKASKEVRHKDCRYLRAVEDGGLPANPEFHQFVLFLKDDVGSEEDAAGNKSGGNGFKVVLTHLEKLQRAAGSGSNGDLEKQKTIRMMLDILSAMLHTGKCKDKGSIHASPLHPERLAAQEEVKELQKAFAEHKAIDACLTFIASKTDIIMESSFRLFVAIQEASHDTVQNMVCSALKKGNASHSLARLEEEMLRCLETITDHISRSDNVSDKADENTLDGEDDSDKKLTVLSQETVQERLRKIKETLGVKIVHRVENALMDLRSGGGNRKDDFGYALKWYKAICRGIGVIVEGGHSELKELMRDQSKSGGQSINFVTRLTSDIDRVRFDEVQKDQHLALDLVTDQFYTLSELCQGNVTNQTFAYDSNVLKHVNAMLAQSIDFSDPIVHVQAKKAAVLVLYMMLEDNSQKAKDLARKVHAQLDVRVVRHAMNAFYLMNLCAKHQNDRVDNARLYAECGFKCYFVLRRLEDLVHLKLYDLFNEGGKRFYLQNDEDQTDSVHQGFEDDEELVKRRNSIERYIKTLGTENIITNKNTKQQPSKFVEGYIKNWMEYVRDLELDDKNGTKQLKAEDVNTFAWVGLDFNDFVDDGKERRVQPQITPEVIMNAFFSHLNFRTGSGMPEELKYDFTRYFSQHTSSIEFTTKDTTLQKVYFEYAENRSALMSQAFRSEILEVLEYATPQDKVRGFLDKFAYIRQQLTTQQKLQKHFITRIVADGSAPWWKNISLVLTYAINIMMLYAFTAPENTSRIDPDTPSWYNTAQYSLGGLHCLISLGVFIEYLVRKWANLSSILRSRISGKQVGDVQVQSGTLVAEAVYYLSFLGFSIAGVIFNGYFFSFHLLHIVQGSATLRRAVEAITTNIKGLALVAWLTFSLVYIFSLISFLYYRNDFDAEGGQYCGTLAECFLTLTIYGLTHGGGIREAVGVGGIDNTTMYYTREQGGRWILDFVFWIIINTIMLNLVLGIIVDTFSQLRAERAKNEDVSKNFCFICSHEKHKFQNVHNEFRGHIKNEHNMWDYVYYTIYLERLQVAERNHFEMFLYKSWIEKKDPDPFPIKRSLSLESGATDDNDDNVLNTITQKMDALNKQSLGVQLAMSKLSAEWEKSALAAE